MLKYYRSCQKIYFWRGNIWCAGDPNPFRQPSTVKFGSGCGKLCLRAIAFRISLTLSSAPIIGKVIAIRKQPNQSYLLAMASFRMMVSVRRTVAKTARIFSSQSCQSSSATATLHVTNGGDRYHQHSQPRMFGIMPAAAFLLSFGTTHFDSSST